MKQHRIPGEEMMMYDRWIKPELCLNNHISTFGERPPRNADAPWHIAKSGYSPVHQKTQPIVHGNFYSQCCWRWFDLDDNAKEGSTLLQVYLWSNCRHITNTWEHLTRHEYSHHCLAGDLRGWGSLRPRSWWLTYCWSPLHYHKWWEGTKRQKEGENRVQSCSGNKWY